MHSIFLAFGWCGCGRKDEVEELRIAFRMESMELDAEM
jgi:hypothetical protein